MNFISKAELLQLNQTQFPYLRFFVSKKVGNLKNYDHFHYMYHTLFESENERQKIEPVPIPLPRASRNFPDVKTRNGIFFHNWTLEIIPFIRFGMQMDGT